MKARVLLLVLAWVLGASTAVSAQAQVTEAQLQPFLEGLSLIQASGDGLKQASGDVLLELASQDPEDNETLVLLRNENGTLRKVAVNSSLLMGRDVLGISGGNYPDLSDGILSVDYTVGSGSSQSDISIKFKGLEDGRYAFKEYTSITRNHGVENLFARERVTAAQTGTIFFHDAEESAITEASSSRPEHVDTGQRVHAQLPVDAGRYVPDGFVVLAFAQGDLNLDPYKEDLLLVLQDDERISVRLLMQKSDGRLALARSNDALLIPDATFSPENLRLVVKNGFFTLEQRVAVDDADFDHRYATFKYDAGRKNWILNSFAVEHYAGFDPKPSKDVTRLGKKQFGTLWFHDMEHLPGI